MSNRDRAIESAISFENASRETKGSASTRRRFLAAAGGAAATGLGGCIGSITGNGSSGAGSSGPLRVATWSGPYSERFRKTIKKRYEEETGNKLQIVPGYSEIISKIKAAPKDDPPYDVTVADGYYYFQGRQSNLFEEIRYDNIPNYEEVFPALKEMRSHDYGVPVDGEPSAIAYSDDLGWEPETYADLYKEDKKLTLSGGFYIYPMQTGAIAADDLDGTDEIYNEDHHDVPFKSLEKMNVTKWFSSGAEIWELFRQGTANIGQYYYATTMLKARDDNLDLNIKVPKVTGGYFDDYCVVRGTDKRKQAEEFLNFLLDADVQTMWSEESWEIKSNKNTEYPDFVRETLPTTNEELKAFKIPDWEYLADYSSDFSDQFKKLKSS